MVERILKIMEHEGLTPSRFAEEIGIQRSAISHILNRRNNVSLDVLLKIIGRFSYVNSDWLLFGKGEMFQDNLPVASDIFENTAINSSGDTADSEYRKDSRAYTSVNNMNKSVIEQLTAVQKPVRNVSKIMVFYTDNTFETYIPEKEKKE